MSIKKQNKPVTCKQRCESGDEEGQQDGGPGDLQRHRPHQHVDADAQRAAHAQRRQIQAVQASRNKGQKL